MIKTVSFYDFCDSFSEDRKATFSYEGKRALFDYLEEYEEETGEKIELDIVALCCEYTEYESALEAISEHHQGDAHIAQTAEGAEDLALERLQEMTQVIEVEGGGVIILDF